MPFVSLAQEHWAHANPEKFGKKNLKEWDAATKGKKLPARKKKKSSNETVPHLREADFRAKQGN